MKSKLPSALLFDEWPAADRQAWERAIQPQDMFDPVGGAAAKWGGKTRRQHQTGYALYLGWLKSRGELELGLEAGERAALTLVTAYYQDMCDAGLADYTRIARLQSLGDALRVMFPPGDWSYIGRAAARVSRIAVHARDLRACMKPPEEIFAAGLDMMRAAEQDGYRTDVERATLFRDGLLIASLIRRPLRISNLAQMRLGKQVERRGEHWWLVFEGDEMKAGRDFECPWPADLTDALERYVGIHRPRLLEKCKQTPSDDFWISRYGTSMDSGSIRQIITLRTRQAFGVSINPHTFRHIAATSIATGNPENVTDVMAVLGHAGMETSERHYILARGTKAAGAYHAAIRKRPRSR